MDKNQEWDESRVVSALTLDIRQPENAKVYQNSTTKMEGKPEKKWSLNRDFLNFIGVLQW